MEVRFDISVIKELIELIDFTDERTTRTLLSVVEGMKSQVTLLVERSTCLGVTQPRSGSTKRCV